MSVRNPECGRPNIGERGGGAISAPMAIATIALLVAIGLGIDGVRAAQGLATADAIAEEAARAAGQALDVSELRRGTAAVDPVAAVAAAQAHLTVAGVDGTVAVLEPQRIRVEVRVTRPTVLLGLIGREEITSTGSAEALLVMVPPEGGPP
jgi:Flp pilus assembly protein TadG